MPPTASTTLLLFEHAPGGVGEGGNPLDPALVGQWVAALAGGLTVGDGLLAGLGERDEWDAAETEFAAASSDDEPLDPAPSAGRLDEEVESLTVAVSPRRSGAEKAGERALSGCRPGGFPRRLIPS